MKERCVGRKKRRRRRKRRTRKKKHRRSGGPSIPSPSLPEATRPINEAKGSDRMTVRPANVRLACTDMMANRLKKDWISMVLAMRILAPRCRSALHRATPRQEEAPPGYRSARTGSSGSLPAGNPTPGSTTAGAMSSTQAPGEPAPAALAPGGTARGGRAPARLASGGLESGSADQRQPRLMPEERANRRKLSSSPLKMPAASPI